MKKYLWVIPLVVLLCFVFACQDKAAMAELENYKAQATLDKAQAAVEEQNKALAIHYMNVSQKGDIAAITETLPPNFVWHAQGKSGNLGDAIESIKGNLATFSDWAFITGDIIAKGDKVIIRSTVKATHTGDGLGFPATGKKVEADGIEILRIENGKIVESWAAQDTLIMAQQLGFELKPKEEKKK